MTVGLLSLEPPETSRRRMLPSISVHQCSLSFDLGSERSRSRKLPLHRLALIKVWRTGSVRLVI